MGRLPRLEFPGATYHVFNRGHRREALFREPSDYRAFLRDLEELADEHGMSVLAFCLMPNHPHLLVRTNRDPLSRVMHRLFTRLAKRFNHKYGVEGHLQQGRYRAILVESDSYLRTLVRYIHQNPSRALLVRHPSEWRYSSHAAYLGEHFDWVETEHVLTALGGVDRYRSWIGEPLSVENLENIRAPVEGFRMIAAANTVVTTLERVQSHLGAEAIRRWQPLGASHPRRRAAPTRPIASEAATWAARHGVDLVTLCSASRHPAVKRTRRDLIVHLAREGYLLREIGDLLGRQQPRISKILRSLGDGDRVDRSGTTTDRHP